MVWIVLAEAHHPSQTHQQPLTVHSGRPIVHVTALTWWREQTARGGTVSATHCVPLACVPAYALSGPQQTLLIWKVGWNPQTSQHCSPIWATVHQGLFLSVERVLCGCASMSNQAEGKECMCVCSCLSVSVYA